MKELSFKILLKKISLQLNGMISLQDTVGIKKMYGKLYETVKHKLPSRREDVAVDFGDALSQFAADVNAPSGYRLAPVNLHAAHRPSQN